MYHNVGKTAINQPFGNGKHATYKNADLGDGLCMIGLPGLNDMICSWEFLEMVQGCSCHGKKGVGVPLLFSVKVLVSSQRRSPRKYHLATFSESRDQLPCHNLELRL